MFYKKSSLYYEDKHQFPVSFFYCEIYSRFLPSRFPFRFRSKLKGFQVCMCVSLFSYQCSLWLFSFVLLLSCEAAYLIYQIASDVSTEKIIFLKKIFMTSFPLFFRNFSLRNRFIFVLPQKERQKESGSMLHFPQHGAGHNSPNRKSA